MNSREEIESELKKKYDEFFKVMNINRQTGLVKDGNNKEKRFCTFAFIGSNYGNGEQKKVLFIGLDVGSDELFIKEKKEDRFQDFEDRRKFENKDITKHNPHISGTLLTAWYVQNIEAKRIGVELNNTYKEIIKKHKDLFEIKNPLKYISLINFYKFVTKNRKKRLGNENRKPITKNSEKYEIKLLLDEIEILNPEIIIFQSKEFNKPKYKVVMKELTNRMFHIGYHPSHHEKDKSLLFLLKDLKLTL